MYIIVRKNTDLLAGHYRIIKHEDFHFNNKGNVTQILCSVNSLLFQYNNHNSPTLNTRRIVATHNCWGAYILFGHVVSTVKT